MLIVVTKSVPMELLVGELIWRAAGLVRFCTHLCYRTGYKKNPELINSGFLTK